MGGNPVTFSGYHDLVLIAYCIEAVHGGVYAWAYLSEAGFADVEILHILANRPADALDGVSDVRAKAQAAMRIIGKQQILERTRDEA